MNYTDEDIRRYIDSFPGDCILYQMKDGGLCVAAYSGHVPETFGFTPEEYLAMRECGPLAGVLENDREYVMQSVKKLAAERCPMDIYFRVVHKKSGFVWLHTKGKLIGTYEGEPLLAVEYLNATLETENINSLLNNDPNLLYVCDAKTWELLYANRAALANWKRQDYVGQPCYRLIKGRDEPCENCIVCRMKDGYAHDGELYDEILNRWLQIDCYATVWYGRKAFFQRVSDITNSHNQEQSQLQLLREAVQTAERANRAKSDFLSRMSHDMRTPLNGILGLTELMEGKEDLQEIRTDLAQLELSGKYLLNLINDTLDVSKIENGKLELRPCVCDGRDVFDNALSLLRPNLEKKKINLVIHADNVVFRKLYIDVGRVEQVIFNVVGNSIKFTPEGGTIEVTLENLACEQNILYDRITVRDTGIGISSEFLPHIFNPFSQENGGSRSKYEGTGLGMVIAKQIVELMGGEISIRSEKGKGTECVFTMKFPIAGKEQLLREDTKRQKADPGSLKGRRILLCEDNALNAEIAESMLRMQGMLVDWAQDGYLGTEKFRNAPEGYYDAVLMDIRMPVMNGLEAAGVIRSMDRADAKSIPVIAMTANAFDEDRENSIAAGMNGHLSKPVSAQSLCEMLAECIHEKPLHKNE